MTRKNTLLGVSLILALLPSASEACTRLVYESGKGDIFVGRSLDWNEDTATELWAYPKGMKRNGGIDETSIEWTSRYGSITSSIYSIATVDGMNEAGLAGNMLYLAEADYGTEAKSGKKSLSVGAWLQYVLDNYGTVAEAVTALQSEPFRIVAPKMPTGDAAGAHLALSDATGDNAVLEYIGGKLVIHHGKQYRTMTNSPSYDQQLAINAYWEEVGGAAMLPGTYRAADRFVRASYNLKTAPKFDDKSLALAAVFSMVRTISVPFGINDPQKPNIATTYWRTVSDIKAKRYYYESATSPAVFWVDLEKLNLTEGASPRKLDLKANPILAGETSSRFTEATPFMWLRN